MVACPLASVSVLDSTAVLTVSSSAVGSASVEVSGAALGISDEADVSAAGLLTAAASLVVVGGGASVVEGAGAAVWLGSLVTCC